MNPKILAVVAVAMISLGIFGLIGLWVYSRIGRKPRRAKRRNSDLIVVHRFKERKRRTMRPALAAQSVVMPVGDSGDDSRWQRPGVASSPIPTERPPLPFYEPGKPRHVFIAHTPGVIIPHQTVGPEPRKPLSQATRSSRRTVLIKTIRVDK
jgi:hypothetical protein